MTGLIIAIIIVAWVGSIFACMTLGMDREQPKFYWAAGVIFTAGLGGVIQAVIDERAKGPCVAYETQWHYNAATKTTMPAKVCVNRGEWVTE